MTITQQMAHPEESTLPQTYCFLQLAFPSHFNPSSQTLTIPLSLLNVIYAVRNSKCSHTSMTKPAHENQSSTSMTSSIVTVDPANLTPHVSILRPHYTTKDRLHLWRPATNDTSLSCLPYADAQHIQYIMIYACAGSTQEAYGSGILTYHVYCDSNFINEAIHASTSSELISAFISNLARSYSEKTISSYVYSIRTWHTPHRKSWSLDDDKIDAMLRAVKNLTPSSSRRKKRLSHTVAFITSILQKLDPNNPLNATVGSCLTIAFYSMARAGKFTIQTLSSFDPFLHIKHSDICYETDCNGLTTTVFICPARRHCKTRGPHLCRVFYSRFYCHVTFGFRWVSPSTACCDARHFHHPLSSGCSSFVRRFQILKCSNGSDE